MTTAVQGFKDALGFLAKMTKMITGLIGGATVLDLTSDKRNHKSDRNHALNSENLPGVAVMHEIRPPPPEQLTTICVVYHMTTIPLIKLLTGAVDHEIRSIPLEELFPAGKMADILAIPLQQLPPLSMGAEMHTVPTIELFAGRGLHHNGIRP